MSLSVLYQQLVFQLVAFVEIQQEQIQKNTAQQAISVIISAPEIVLHNIKVDMLVTLRTMGQIVHMARVPLVCAQFPQQQLPQQLHMYMKEVAVVHIAVLIVIRP